MIEEPIQAYPLAWPPGWKRTQPQSRERARFYRHDVRYENGKKREYICDLTVANGVERVLEQLDLMSVPEHHIRISTNVQTRRDGLPRSGAAEPGDPGAAVYWTAPRGQRRCMAIDFYHRVADNLAAIAATLNAMRAIKRHGGAAILDRAFTGFRALPAPEQWWQVLGLSTDHPTEEQIQAAWRELAKNHHPAVGGDEARMARSNAARDRGLTYIAGTE